jgi:hypothetical protein
LGKEGFSFTLKILNLIDLKELERLKKTPLIASQRKQSLANHGRFGENEFSKKNPRQAGIKFNRERILVERIA